MTGTLSNVCSIVNTSGEDSPDPFDEARDGSDWPIARLIHINGAPAAGKTSLARRFLVDHPLALTIDIDDLRTHLGQWAEREESRVIARRLALALAEAHLASGHDVVVPQYVGRIDFIDQLAALAARHRAPFVEVVLLVEPAVSIDRFGQRRADLSAQGVRHPEADVDGAAIGEVIDDAIRRLADVSRARPTVREVAADDDLETTYRALLAAIDEQTR
jgi:predicted kinase